MVALHTRGCRQGREKKLRGSRRISSGRATTCAGADRASCTRPDTRSNPAPRARPCTWPAARPTSGASRGARRDDTGLSCSLRRYGRRRRNDRLWGLCLRWNYRLGRIRRRTQSHILESLLGAGPAAPSAATTRGSWPTAAERVLTRELIGGERVQNQKNDQGMRKKRGGDTLPPPLSSARNADRRPIASFSLNADSRLVVSFYCVGSFGETPMTFTPAPRATSIA